MKEIRRIAVIGLGQIGGSLVLSIRKRKLPYHITGIDKSRKRLRLLARSLNASATNPVEIRDADLVIVCLHYRDLIEYLKTASKNLLLMDVCSTKQRVVEFAVSRNLRFIGGHPMAGNERAGEAGWDADLFEGRPFFLCPTGGAGRSDLAAVKRFVAALHAKSKIVDPAEHDQQLTSTSHFAAILSILYARLTKDSKSVFRGPGHRSMTRLASSSPEILQTFLESNRENVLAVSEKFQQLLGDWIVRTKKRSIAVEVDHKTRQLKGR